MRLSRLKPPIISKDQEEECRKFYLKTDINQTKWGILLFLIPMFSFIINDYIFFGISSQFTCLAAIRFFMLTTSILAYSQIRKTVNPNSYDRTLFVVSSSWLIFGGIINVFRPENFVAQAIITSISIFVVYLVIPFRFKYQFLLGTLAAIGEAAIVLIIAKPSNPATFTIIFSLIFSNVIAAFSSWQLQSYRRNAFREYQKRIEIQKDLERNNLHLEEIVAEKTLELKKTERLAAIGSTAGMVGHDLRNPLTAISGATYYLKKNYGEQLDVKGVKMLELIQNNVTFSDKIINDLLDYSREIHLEKTKTTLNNVLHEALNLINIPSAIQTSYNISKTHEVTADFNKLKRVFVNLIKNAVDAMPNGGNLEIRTEPSENNIRIIIVDNGQGISDQNQKNLFQPLFTTKAKGMGFGLAICQRIIEAHDGKIIIRSTLGKGTTVTVELPIKQ
jgi:signal transduction histidine kinase